MAEIVHDDEAIQLKSREGQKETLDTEVEAQDESSVTSRSGVEEDEHGRTINSRSATAPTVPSALVAETPYSTFTPKEKWGIIVLISMASIFSSVGWSRRCGVMR